MADSPTSRSLKYLRKEGYTVAIAEKFNIFIKIRQDLFGWIDLCAIHPNHQGVLGVQTTTTDHIQERIKKAMALPSLKVWLQAGNTAEFHGWAKRGGIGKRKLWTLKKEWVTLDDLLSSPSLPSSSPQPLNPEFEP
jgi:hypothetical protein